MSQFYTCLCSSLVCWPHRPSLHPRFSVSEESQPMHAVVSGSHVCWCLPVFDQWEALAGDLRGNVFDNNSVSQSSDPTRQSHCGASFLQVSQSPNFPLWPSRLRQLIALCCCSSLGWLITLCLTFQRFCNLQTLTKENLSHVLSSLV